jgi:hypothetical protein
MSAGVDTVFDEHQNANASPPGIEWLYWHRARNRILYRKLRPYLVPGEPVLEIGCASGTVVAYLREQGVACEGVDLATRGYVVPSARPHVRLGVDAFADPPERRAAVGAILLLDVLEHLPEPGEFLARCDESFPAAHHVLVTVPARTELWSNYDVYYGHYKRYSLDSLSELRAPASFDLVDSGYFFHALYWAARAAKLFSTERPIVNRAPSLRGVHDVIGRILDWEERAARRSWPGSSLFAVYARRPRT